MIPDYAVAYRADMCRQCPAPCAWQHCAAAHADPCAACHLDRWASFCQAPVPPLASAGLRGLGDVVAIVAAPIGSALGLDPARCGCGARQAALNASVPFRAATDPGVVV